MEKEMDKLQQLDGELVKKLLLAEIRIMSA